MPQAFLNFTLLFSLHARLVSFPLIHPTDLPESPGHYCPPQEEPACSHRQHEPGHAQNVPSPPCPALRRPSQSLYTITHIYHQESKPIDLLLLGLILAICFKYIQLYCLCASRQVHFIVCNQHLF